MSIFQRLPNEMLGRGGIRRDAQGDTQPGRPAPGSVAEARLGPAGPPLSCCSLPPPPDAPSHFVHKEKVGVQDARGAVAAQSHSIQLLHVDLQDERGHLVPEGTAQRRVQLLGLGRQLGRERKEGTGGAVAGAIAPTLCPPSAGGTQTGEKRRGGTPSAWWRVRRTAQRGGPARGTPTFWQPTTAAAAGPRPRSSVRRAPTSTRPQARRQRRTSGRRTWMEVSTARDQRTTPTPCMVHNDHAHALHGPRTASSTSRAAMARKTRIHGSSAGGLMRDGGMRSYTSVSRPHAG